MYTTAVLKSMERSESGSHIFTVVYQGADERDVVSTIGLPATTSDTSVLQYAVKRQIVALNSLNDFQRNIKQLVGLPISLNPPPPPPPSDEEVAVATFAALRRRELALVSSVDGGNAVDPDLLSAAVQARRDAYAAQDKSPNTQALFDELMRF